MNVVSALAPQTLAPARVEWRPLAGLAGIAPEWRALAARALEPNALPACGER